MKKINRKAQDVALGVGAVIFVALFIIGIIILLMGFDTVEPNHLGVKVAWGQITGVMQPSTQWTGLFVSVISYDMRLRKATIELSGDNYAPSKEGQKIFATIDVNYRVKNDPNTVKSLYANVGTDDVIADRLNINPIVVEGFKQTSSQYTALDILEKRQEVKDKAIEIIKKNFPQQYFEIDNIVITNIAFTKEFADEIEAKQTAIQTALKEQNNLETIKFQQQQILEQAKVDAERIKLQSASLTQLTIAQAWIQKWNGNVPTYLITSQANANMLMQLPTMPLVSEQK
jgi:prohibitin 2